MKTVICLMFACVSMASTVQAQAPAPAPAAQGGQKIPFRRGAPPVVHPTLKLNLAETAQKFDEATYSYTPSKDIRVFGAQLAHVANSQFNACAAAKGEQIRIKVRTWREPRPPGPTSFRRSPIRSRFAIQRSRI